MHSPWEYLILPGIWTKISQEVLQSTWYTHEGREQAKDQAWAHYLKANLEQRNEGRHAVSKACKARSYRSLADFSGSYRCCSLALSVSTSSNAVAALRACCTGFLKWSPDYGWAEFISDHWGSKDSLNWHQSWSGWRNCLRWELPTICRQEDHLAVQYLNQQAVHFPCQQISKCLKSIGLNVLLNKYLYLTKKLSLS